MAQQITEMMRISGILTQSQMPAEEREAEAIAASSVSPREASKRQAEAKLAQLTEDLHEATRRHDEASGFPQSQQTAKEYIQANPEYLRLYTDLTREFSIAPAVAAYALFSTNFGGTEHVFNFIHEPEEVEDSSGHQPKMRHQFVGYLDEDGIERCYICQEL